MELGNQPTHRGIQRIAMIHRDVRSAQSESQIDYRHRHSIRVSVYSS
jgi:hypothetical protein